MDKPLFGRLITAMVTPFDDDLELDFNRCEALVERLIEGGSDSIIVCGTTGESPTISHAHKIELIKTCIKASAGRIPIIANVGNNCTSDSLEFAREVSKCGVDGFMCVVPYYNKPPQEGLYQHFKTIAHAVDEPIILYNIPSRCSINMQASTTLRLAQDCDNIVAVKEASGDIEQIKEIIDKAKGDFVVYSGDDAFTLNVMQAGGVGVISTISNVACRRMKEIVDAAARGEWDKARDLNEKLLPLMEGLFKTANPILVKEALRLTGFSVGGVRLPLVPASKEQSSQLEHTMKEVGVL